MTVTPCKAYIGVDGGGTSTRAALIDAKGSILGEGRSTGSNPHNVGFETAASRIDEAVRSAIDQSTVPIGEIRSAFLGIAGIRNESENSLLRSELHRYSWIPHDRLTIDHDLAIAYHATLEGDPGILLICGTGSAAYGKGDSGKFARASGRSCNPEDPGSGYAIGNSALSQGLISANETDRDGVAELAPRVIELAAGGNEAARVILSQQADLAVDLVRSVDRQINGHSSLSIGLSGSLVTRPSLYRDLIVEALEKAHPDAEIRFPKTNPVLAAAQLAKNSNGPDNSSDSTTD